MDDKAIMLWIVRAVVHGVEFKIVTRAREHLNILDAIVWNPKVAGFWVILPRVLVVRDFHKSPIAAFVDVLDPITGIHKNLSREIPLLVDIDGIAVFIGSGSCCHSDSAECQEGSFDKCIHPRHRVNPFSGGQIWAV